MTCLMYPLFIINTFLPVRHFDSNSSETPLYALWLHSVTEDLYHSWWQQVQTYSRFLQKQSCRRSIDIYMLPAVLVISSLVCFILFLKYRICFVSLLVVLVTSLFFICTKLFPLIVFSMVCYSVSLNYPTPIVSIICIFFFSFSIVF